MEKKWQKRRERSARIKLFFKRVRLPLLTVGGTFLTAFIIIPLALGAYEARAESIEVTASSKQAQPSAQVGDIQIATPEPVMTAEPLPTESTEGFTAPTDAPDDMQQYAPLVFEQRDEAVRALQQRLMDLYYMGSDETTGAPFEGNGRRGRADAADTFQLRRAKLHNQSGLLGRGCAYPPA